MGKIALVAGGTGLVGGHIIRQLCAHTNYTTVIALCRKQPTDDWATQAKVKIQIIDFDHLEQELQNNTVDEIYCALGTTAKKSPSQQQYQKVDMDYPIALAKAGLTASANFYGMVSALGAKEGAISKYSHYNGAVENYLKDSPYKHVAIAQPSLLLGDRSEFRLGETFLSIATPLMPKAIKSVQGSDVAGALISAANSNQSGIEVIPNKHLHNKALASAHN